MGIPTKYLLTTVHAELITFFEIRGGLAKLERKPSYCALFPEHIYAKVHDEIVYVCSWLTDGEFQHLNSDSGKDDLDALFYSLDEKSMAAQIRTLEDEIGLFFI